MVWWYWMILGLVLLGAEMTTPGGFYILFFGLSALLVGTLTGLEVVSGLVAVVVLFCDRHRSLLVFRGPLLARIKTQEVETPAVDSMVGEIAIPLEALAPAHRQGGTAWHHLDSEKCGSCSLEKGSTREGDESKG